MSARRRPGGVGGRAPGAQRRRTLAAVHAGRRALGWSDDVYRAAVADVVAARRAPGAAPVTSAADCTLEELGALLDLMRARGYGRAADAHGTPRTPAPQPFGDGQLGMIRALWAACEALGAVRVPGEAGLRAWAKARHRVDRLEWLRPQQASALIEALKAMRDRAAARQGAPPEGPRPQGAPPAETP